MKELQQWMKAQLAEHRIEPNSGLGKAILNRRNAFFYKTLNGAHTGDLFMTLIHTCELNGANPFDYLTELQRHAAELSAHPPEWMPWNYRDTLARLATPTAA
jgi:transposase